MSNDLLAVDFAPKNLMVLEEHEVTRPCCPVINVHAHVSMILAKPKELADHMMERFIAALGGDNPTTRDFRHTMHTRDKTIEDVVRDMDEAGVEQYVDLDGVLDTPQHLKIYKGHRDRFVLFHLLSLEDWESPDYGKRRAKELQQAVEQGARGLKAHKTIGMTARDSAGNIVPVDDERFDPIWDKAGELGVPILMHVSDPLPYFMPIDEHNIAYRKLCNRPLRWYHPPQYPSKQTILDQRNRMIARHPKTKFIGPHHGNQGEDLAAVGELFDRYPNFYVDMSYALIPLGLQPHTCRKHFIKYQDRIMFGTDGLPDSDRFFMHYRWLETDDDYFDASTGAWPDRICGLNLPKKVLEKIYRKNARRIIPAN